jgi:hypothetical protein
VAQSNFEPHGPLACRHATAIQAAWWAWAGKKCTKLGLERRWSSISIGWLSVDPGRTKPAPGRAQNPSALILHSHLLALSTTTPHRATRSVGERLSRGEETEPATPLEAPRRRARPPLGGRATIEWPHSGVSSRPRAPTRWRALSTLEVSSLSTHRQGGERWLGCSTSTAAPTF